MAKIVRLHSIRAQREVQRENDGCCNAQNPHAPPNKLSGFTQVTGHMTFVKMTRVWDIKQVTAYFKSYGERSGTSAFGQSKASLWWIFKPLILI